MCIILTLVDWCPTQLTNTRRSTCLLKYNNRDSNWYLVIARRLSTMLVGQATL